MEKKITSIAGAPRPTGPYSQALAVGDLLFIAGTLGVDPATDQLVEGVEAQTRLAMDNIVRVLEENGMTTRNIVKTNMFIKNMDHFPVINAVYAPYFPDGEYPVRTCVEISKTPKDGLIEIECIAMRLD